MDFGRLIGILTERDLLAAVASRVQTSEARVREWMTENPVTVPESTPIEKPASVMVARGFRHLPIVDGEQTIGIVRLRDVVRSVVRVYPEHEDETEYLALFPDREGRQSLSREPKVRVGGVEAGQELAIDHCPERKTSRFYLGDEPSISHPRPAL